MGPEGVTDEKTESTKSRDTVPLSIRVLLQYIRTRSMYYS
jgi:hypothetical protein